MSDILDELVGKLQKNGYFEHKHMSDETKKEFSSVKESLDKFEEKLDAIKASINSKVSWTAFVGIGVGVLGYITALMGILWAEIKQINTNVESFDKIVTESKIDQFKISERLESLEKQQSLLTNIFNQSR